ncbi:tyrosine-protein phosphatase 10D-like isoform X2 [Argonauta hians]
MELRLILMCLGFTILGILQAKVLAQHNHDYMTEFPDNTPKLLFPSNVKTTQQQQQQQRYNDNDNDGDGDAILSILSQTNTNTMPDMDYSQNKITNRNLDFETNEIGTNYKEELFIGKGNTVENEPTIKERPFTRAILSLEDREENNDIVWEKSSTKITKETNRIFQSVSSLSTKSQSLVSNKLNSLPATAKVVNQSLRDLHITNATETSLSVAWKAPKSMNQFQVSVEEVSDRQNIYGPITVNNTFATIRNLSCSGCPYRISVTENMPAIGTNSQTISGTNYTVPLVPNITKILQPNAITIQIDIDPEECATLRNDQNWEITKNKELKKCQIEKDGLLDMQDYHLNIWRKVDVWESRKKYITFRLSSSQYTVDVYAINTIGQSLKTTKTFTTKPAIPGAIDINIIDVLAMGINLSLHQPDMYRGDILGYMLKLEELSNTTTTTTAAIFRQKNPLIYNIRCDRCRQQVPYTDRHQCPCYQCVRVQTQHIYYLSQPFLLWDLTPYTKYSISARAYTAAGCGAQVQKIFTTEESTPSKVRQLAVVYNSSHQIRVTWNIPEHPNGEIKLYKISLYLNTLQLLENTTTNTSYSFEKLTPYTNYTIEVSAQNSHEGEISRIFVGTTSDVPSPVHPSIYNTTSKTITIKWETPKEPNGPITVYKVFYKNVQEYRTKEKGIPVGLKTQYTLDNLEPYRTYEIFVRVCNDQFHKDSDPLNHTTLAGVPHPVRNPTANPQSAKSILVQWDVPMQYTGPTHYIITGESNKTSHILIGPYNVSGFNTKSILIKNLEEYWPYSFNITSKTSAGESTTVSTLITWTKESTPGPVQSLDVYVNYSCSIGLLVCWTKPLPENENGKILKYEITYWTDDKEKKHKSVTSTVFSTMMVAWGEHNYTIQIRAATSVGFGEVRNRTVYVRPHAPVVPNGVVITRSNEEVEDSSRQIAINLPNKFFEDFTFGIPRKWGLIIAEAGTVNLSGVESNFDPLSFYKWRDVYDDDTMRPYRATSTDWKPPIILAKDRNAAFIIGAEEDCEDPHTFCNGYLKPNTNYHVKAFMCTRGGCTGTRYSAALHTDKDPTPIYITVPVLLVVAGVAVNIIFIMWNKKLYCFKKRPIATVSSIVDRNQNGKVNHSFVVKNCENSRPVLLAHFHSKVEMMKRDSNLQFCEEFKQLKSSSPAQTHVAAELQANRTKNRYTNILAYDHSRVKLLPLDDDEGSDYINANYIPGYSLVREYIAAQGPLHSTKDDFWRMIWEQNVSIVVMVTMTVERGRVKCEDYWPKGNEPVYFGDLVVQLKSESNLSDFDIRILDVSLGEKIREVKQFHFLKWPDFGCPQNTSLLINFVQTVRTHMPYINTGPTLVHCSAGVGRTGTFIVIDRLLQHIQYHSEVDIFGLILELRKYRPNMVQTEDQYIYIYQCIADHLKHLEAVNSENIYINETGM